MTYKVLTHIHSKDSHDSWMTRQAIIDAAKYLGADLVLAVEHDSISKHPPVESGIRFMNGIEITMTDGVHVVVYNPPADMRLQYNDKCDYAALTSFLDHSAHDCVLCIPHPLRASTGLFTKTLDQPQIDLLGRARLVELLDGKRSLTQADRDRIRGYSQKYISHPLFIAALDAHEPINLLSNYNVVETDSLLTPFSGSWTTYECGDKPDRFRKKDYSFSFPLVKCIPLWFIKILSYFKYRRRLRRFRKQVNQGKTYQYVQVS